MLITFCRLTPSLLCGKRKEVEFSNLILCRSQPQVTVYPLHTQVQTPSFDLVPDLSSSDPFFFSLAETMSDRSNIKVSSADGTELLSLAIVAQLLAEKQLVFALGRLLCTVDLSPFEDVWAKVLEEGGCKKLRGWVVG